MIKRFFICLSVVMMLVGCNTVSGIGKDIKAGGQAIEDASQKK
jgi:predicted small secreted protein